MTRFEPHGVHLTGSICLSSAEEVFRKTTALLPGRLRRIPDGETQHRQNFFRFQRDAFAEAGASQALRKYDAQRNPLPSDPVPPEEVELLAKHLSEHLHTGYDTHAIESYSLFARLRDEGVIPPGVRFQVSLPTPVNVMTTIAPPYQAALEPVYEAALLRDLRRIEAAVPPGDLAVQWDCAIEFAILEGVEYPAFRPWFAGEGDDDAAARRAHIDAALVRLGRAVGGGVELGYHLCYGDQGHRHFCEPRDTGLLVDVAWTVVRGVGRRVAWLHLPVPKSRDDDAYFAPLVGLVPALRKGGTEIYLGLVHVDDDEGTRRRIEAASRVLGAFGVGTECGMGRTPPEDFDSIMAISAAVSSPILSPPQSKMTADGADRSAEK
ncbi:hypothetical protein INS49_010810 [Diaporthe citri]|uniref:uncharacterized protein n=1 Tax=Diaporthe citri TaxID=83186 RepID=UPI001C7FACED|nr:uncharacterized protein INS49_010810 [Diaporthe citri]KAG6359758.1 hypothetical protein INS49_010810 [Diaporthe citri]